MIDWIVAGLAATLLHKKFPKQTEAVAKGVLKTTEFVARRGYETLTKPEARTDELKQEVWVCCQTFFAAHPDARSCGNCGSPNKRLG